MPSETNGIAVVAAAAIAVVALVLFAKSLSRRRQAIRHRFRQIVLVGIVYFFAVFVVFNLTRNWVEAVLAGLVVEMLVISRSPSRSRHIPADVRRRAIARWTLETGKRFDPRKYELDHEIPFAGGGDHSEENIRVIEKRANRSKGRKAPRWDLFGRR